MGYRLLEILIVEKGEWLDRPRVIPYDEK